jgi:AcrR family transcriptional regulator
VNEKQLADPEPVRPGEVRARGHYRKGIKRRQDIVKAAAEVFAEFGYSGGSIRTIADRVGASPATLMQYFGSKEGLLAAVLEDWRDQSHRLRATNLRGLAYINSMRDVMPYHVEHRGQIELFLTMTAEASSLNHPAHQFIQNRYATSVAEMCQHFREAVEAQEIGPLSAAQIEQETRMMFAIMDGIELQWLLDPTVDMVALFNRYLDEAIKRWQKR